jgi:hypothetical protein
VEVEQHFGAVNCVPESCKAILLDIQNSTEKDFEGNLMCRMASSRMLRRVALARTDVSEELSASFIKVTTIGELALFLVHRFL